MKNEPVLTASAVVAVIGAVLGYLTTAGIISSTDASAWTQIAAVAVPIILPLAAGMWARRKVTPTKQP